MKKSIFILFLIASTSMIAQSTWKVDGSHSSVNFSITHLVISEVTGNFGKFDIEATADEAFSNPVFSVSIESASINTNNGMRDGHLQNEDYFSAEANPAITFKSTSYKKTGDKTFDLTGDLTVKGVTKTVTFNGKLNGIITDQRSKKLKAGLKLTTTVVRKDFNIGNDNPGLGDDVEVSINLEMAQQ